MAVAPVTVSHTPLPLADAAVPEAGEKLSIKDAPPTISRATESSPLAAAPVPVSHTPLPLADAAVPEAGEKLSIEAAPPHDFTGDWPGE